MADEGQKPDDTPNPIEAALEGTFNELGRAVARTPWVFIGISVLVSIVFGAGKGYLKDENRPEKQWVPEGALAIDHGEYIGKTWPSQQRFNMYIATCQTADGEDDPNCNMFTAAHAQRLNAIHNEIMGIVVDGDGIVAEMDAAYPGLERVWAGWAGKWSFEGAGGGGFGGLTTERTWIADASSQGYTCASGTAGNGGCCQESIQQTCDCNSTAGSCVSDDSTASVQSACFKFGPFCAAQGLLDVFAPALAMFAPTASYQSHVANLTDAMVLADVNGWNSVHHQNHGCYDMDGVVWTNNGSTHPVAHQCHCSPDLCSKQSCESGVGAEASTVATGYTKRVWMSGCSSCDCEDYDAAHPNASEASSPFNSDRFHISKVAGGLTGSQGSYSAAKAVFGFYALSKNEIFNEATGRVEDHISSEWERQALCKLGIASGRDRDMTGEDSPALTAEDCPEDDLIRFKMQFTRSISDEFGSAITGDLLALILAYYLMAGYLFIMLSRYDTVNSMLGMSCVALTICGMSFMSCLGLGHYVGLYNNNLNTNIPFLLLGLGIDDAFVLTSEFIRAMALLGPGADLEDITGEAMKGGGISILVTSLTDAVAFLVGSSTVMPALRWFCLFAGFGIIFCFLFQIFMYVPFLVLNERRARANKLDCCICIEAASPHDINEPQGCCGLLCVGYTPGNLGRFLKDTWGPAITSQQGMMATGATFFILLVVSIVGVANIEVDFKIEWFIPDDSYLNQFYSLNDHYFKQGTGFSVYTRQADYGSATSQSEMLALDSYLETSPYVDSTEAITNWHKSFIEYCDTTTDNTSLPLNTWGGDYSTSTHMFTDTTTFWSALTSFYRSTDGSRYRSSMSWSDSLCEKVATWTNCNTGAGLVAARINAVIAADKLNSGMDRYDTMEALRSEVAAKAPGLDAFPYTREFSNWEEVGIIGGEMVRNLLICGAVIIVVIFMLIPRPEISCWVIACILLSIIDVVGMLHWWGVTVNSISTIYILISIGLAVDYSAHIAHMFKESKGTAQERACAALGRIGPCVLNAVISTFLAVVMFGFSKSYIFRTMFKAFFLVVVIAGAHGLWLLPVLLTLGGGDNGEAEEELIPVSLMVPEVATENPLEEEDGDDTQAKD